VRARSVENLLQGILIVDLVHRLNFKQAHHQIFKSLSLF
jgi:hypothetical protein